MPDPKQNRKLRLVASLADEWSALAVSLKTEASDLHVAETLAEMKRVHEEMYPETRHGGTPGAQGPGHGGKTGVPRHWKSLNRKDDGPSSLPGRHAAPKSFVQAAYEATGWRTPATISRYVKVATDICGQAREKIHGSPLANRIEMLKRIGQLKSERQQVDVADLYVGSGEAKAKKALFTYLDIQRRKDSKPTHHEAKNLGSTVGDGLRDTVLFGDALTRLRELPDNHVSCVVTSPPFYQLRDFGTRHWMGGTPKCKHDRTIVHRLAHPGQVGQTKWKKAGKGPTAVTSTCSKCGAWHGQLGQEPTVQAYVIHMVEVFRELRRVLRDDGVAWLEIGDSYQPDKSLFLVPQRLAVALQEDGWIVRSEVIWAKTAGLPESVDDRPTRSHSTVWQLVKGADYYYDPVAVMEPAKGAANDRGTGNKNAHGRSRKYMAYREHIPTRPMTVKNLRSVWSLPVGRYPGSHTAVFPPDIPSLCIRASTSEKGSCVACGAPWKRLVSRAEFERPERPAKEPWVARKNYAPINDNTPLPPPETLGWEPSCACKGAGVTPAIVLDPFTGSGTTLAVAKSLGRSYLGIELNEQDYRTLIQERLAPPP